ncbi:MAG TPA: cupin-like domain-containing protein [Steroidobacteraceae bacterium]|nr:cupin-like domain-containing protein [Steroidobacteraceae bacterium]
MSNALPLQPIPVRDDIDPERFQSEIVAQDAPVVLRGLVAAWPAVAAGASSAAAMRDYLLRFDAGRRMPALIGQPAIQGRFFYRDDMRGFNFERRDVMLREALDVLLGATQVERAPAAYIESTPIAEHLPGFAEQNPLALLPATVAPRIWIGNAVTAQTHFDLQHNIACVVAGRRRFTLFPPDQLPNLYVGPFDFTLSGPPVSMVSLYEPDFDRYPKFRQALEHARTAELGPGDALYIPYFWWHHVQSLERFNVLVNYWWQPTRTLGGSPFDCLLHAILNLRDLQPAQRDAWRIVFDHYVFQRNGDPMAHLPPEHRGMLGPMTPERAREIKSILVRLLGR